MRFSGFLVIVLVKAAILFMYVELQDTILSEVDGAYRFLFYLIGSGCALFTLGLTWRKANVTEVHGLARLLVIPSIILLPALLLLLYFSFGSFESFIRPFQDAPGLMAFFVSELLVIIIVFLLLKLALRRQIQVP